MSEKQIPSPEQVSLNLEYGMPADYVSKAPSPEEQAASREQAETNLRARITETFDHEAKNVLTDPDGTHHLALYMPWKGGGRRGSTVATIELARYKEGDSTTTLMSFKAKGAWDSHAILDADGIHDARTNEAGKIEVRHETTIAKHGEDFVKMLKANTWISNLAAATAEKPSMGRKSAVRFLGSKALKS